MLQDKLRRKTKNPGLGDHNLDYEGQGIEVPQLEDIHALINHARDLADHLIERENIRGNHRRCTC